MFNFRRFPCRTLLLSLAVLIASCSAFSGDASRREGHASRGGFTVRVDGPGLPTMAGVVSDIGAYARRLGFVRQPTRVTPQFDPVTHEPLPPVPERYVLNGVALEVSRQTADHRVSAYLYASGPKVDRKLIERFFQGFDKEYAGRYGGEDRLSETAYADDSAPGRSRGSLEPGGSSESNSPRESGVPAESPGGPSASGAPLGRP